MAKIDINAACKIYTEVTGMKVTPSELKNHVVHHPLGQCFWRANEITHSDFVWAMKETLSRQKRNAERNDALINAAIEKAFRKSQYLEHRFDDE